MIPESWERSVSGMGGEGRGERVYVVQVSGKFGVFVEDFLFEGGEGVLPVIGRGGGGGVVRVMVHCWSSEVRDMTESDAW